MAALSEKLPLEAQLCAVDGQAQFFPERAFEFEGLDGTVVCTQEMHTGGMIWDAEVILAHLLVERFGADADADAGDADTGDADTGDAEADTGAGSGCADEQVPDPPEGPSSPDPLPTSLPRSLEGKRVIELGAGAGLAGIVAAQLGAAVVVFTEIAKVLPVLQQNIKANLPDAVGAGEEGGLEGGNEGEAGSGEGRDGEGGGGDGMTPLRVACCEQWWGEALAGPVAEHAPFDLILVRPINLRSYIVHPTTAPSHHSISPAPQHRTTAPSHHFINPPPRRLRTASTTQRSSRLSAKQSPTVLVPAPSAG